MSRVAVRDRAGLVGVAASNDVFISYRRDVAGYVALALQQHLTAAGIDAFYDIDSIHTGQFDTIILNQIAARPYFVLVLTPGTLDRCVDPSDWLRREVQHAVDTGRRIVPVHTPEFVANDFERYLPLNLGRDLARWQALELPHKYFKYAAGELVTEYLVALDDVAVTPTPAADHTAVQRARQRTEAAPTVTTTQLDAQAHLERALAQHHEGELDAAIVGYGQAIELDPTNTAAFNSRGIAHRARGDLDEAIADYDRAIELDPWFSWAFYNRASARRQQGDLDEAIADYDRAIELDPTDPETFFNRGHARNEQGDVAGAIADYDRAIELDPTDPQAFYNRGLERRRQGDVAGAIADYDRAIELDPTDPQAFYNRAFAREKQGDVAGAIADYDRAIELDPTDPAAFFNRGLARKEEGDVDGAIQDLRIGRQLAPDDPDYDRELRALGAD